MFCTLREMVYFVFACLLTVWSLYTVWYRGPRTLVDVAERVITESLPTTHR